MRGGSWSRVGHRVRCTAVGCFVSVDILRGRGGVGCGTYPKDVDVAHDGAVIGGEDVYGQSRIE